MYPNTGGTSENPRTISDEEIQQMFKTLGETILPESETEKIRSMSCFEFSKFLYESIKRNEVAQQIISKFEENGIYLAAEYAEDTREPYRYIGVSHEIITSEGTMKIVENYLRSTDEELWAEFIEKIDTGNVAGITEPIKKFSYHVKQEDEIDFVFNLHQQFYIDMGNYGKEYLPLDLTKDAVTISHFWNPDSGWNFGNKKVWQILYPIFKQKVIDKIKQSSGGWVIPDNEIVEMILRRMRPEYAVVVLQNPPSSYYKALCLWYGWVQSKWGNGTLLSSKIYPGIKDLKFLDSQKAAIYLAHVIHLLQDASVPAHVHNDPHGSDLMSGLDIWENIISNTFITKVVNADSYSFKININLEITDFEKYSSKNINALNLSENGKIFSKSLSIEEQIRNLTGLYVLFFNTAQAAQLFPTFKTIGVINFPGNNVILNGNYYLNAIPELNGSVNYNDSNNFTIYTPDPNSDTALADYYPVYFTGTYYLIYIGREEDKSSISFDKNLLEIKDGFVRVKDPTRFKIYFIGYPFDKMADNLVPLSIAMTAQLIRYFRWIAY